MRRMHQNLHVIGTDNVLFICSKLFHFVPFTLLDFMHVPKACIQSPDCCGHNTAVYVEYAPMALEELCNKLECDNTGIYL